MSENKEQFPSLSEQGKNLMDLIGQIASDGVIGKQIFASEFEQQRRYDICQVCEHFESRAKRCKKCGCFMKNKVTFQSAECPIKKW